MNSWTSPIHPGEILADELEGINMNTSQFAKRINMAENELEQILQGKGNITGDIALKLGRFFNTGAEIWMNLQKAYELDVAKDKLGNTLIVSLVTQLFINPVAEDLVKPLRVKLWGKIKNRLTGKSDKVNEALANVEKGDSTAIETIRKHLDMVLDEDPDFAEELRGLAQTIQAGKIQDNSRMVQNNSDHAKGWQTKVEEGTAYIGEIHINQAQNPKI